MQSAHLASFITFMRDTQLDIYRALIMIYTLCVIHTMHWLADGREPYLSLLLIEMPLIFFISGASFSLSHSRRGLWGTFVNRFKRVVAPYYIYAVVLLVLAAAGTIVLKMARLSELLPVDLTSYGLKDVASILLAQDIPQFPFIWHLWFIPTYLILSCTFPLQVKLIEKVGKWPYAVACLVLFLLVQAVTRQALINQVLGYNIFMVGGYLFYKKVNVPTTMLVGALALAAVLVGVYVFGVDFIPMQVHKFPPDWFFVAYNIFTLCLVALVLGRVKLKSRPIWNLWSVRGYNIYLYHSVVFTLVELSRQQMGFYIPHPLCRLIVDAALVFVLATGLSCITYPLERFVMKKLKLIV